MMTTSRSLVGFRPAFLMLASLFLALSGCAGGPSPTDASSRSATIVLRSLAAAASPDGSGTTVTFRGNLPMSYSISPERDRSWSLTLDGVDPRFVDREISVGSPQLERIEVHTISGGFGRPAAQVDFRGVRARDRRIRLDGNELVVELVGQKEPAPKPGSAVEGAASTPLSGSVILGAGGPAPSSNPGYKLAGSAPPGRAATPPPDVKGSLDLTVGTGRSITLDLESPVSRISVANPSVADAVVISPQQILVNGIAPGTTSLVLWFRSGESRNYSLAVQMDTEALTNRLEQFFPDESISVGTSKETLFLYGTVSRPEIGEKAAKIASDYSGKVVNHLTYPPSGRRQILLKVVFAEVNRQAMTELSASFLRVDPNNPRGDHEGLGTTGTPGPLGNWINTPRGPDFSFNDAINVYAFNFRDKIGGFLTALKTRGLLQVLAEPTLIAADGQKASFLAGGEFPIPVIQAGAGFNSVTIIFKKFGISLDFTPEIRDDGTIVLQVEPEVSSLDFANAVVLTGFTIPSLKVRRANTEVELKNGQSFAIAGLYSADLQQTKKRIPVLGDIPLLGNLFRSKNLNKNKTELLVIATPTLVEPLPPGEKPSLPQFDLSLEIEKKKPKKLVAPELGREGS